VTIASTPPAARWLDHPGHLRWLADEGDRLLGFYQWSALDPVAGFAWLDRNGRPVAGQPSQLWITARMVHSFSLAHLSGRPGALGMAEHGLRALMGPFVDAEHSGWYRSVDVSGPVDANKEAYQHSFVLLAGASASLAGIAGGLELLGLAREVVDTHFWDDETGMCVDRWDRAWQHLDPYRGQNANMHMTEAFLAAADATGEGVYLARAARIADRVIRQVTAASQWRLPEHYKLDWTPDFEYGKGGSQGQFRGGYGSCVGHWFEWARLLLQLRYSEVGEPWMLDAAEHLFDQAVVEGWDSNIGGVRLFVDFHGAPLDDDRYHWVIAEAIGAAAMLERATADERYRRWYQTFWSYADRYVLDRQQGSWHHQLDPLNQPKYTVWDGKPDLYHAYQSTLCASAPLGLSFAAALAAEAVTLH
jgi:sulfoquinovose isomerase